MGCVRMNTGYKELKDSFSKLFSKYNINKDAGDYAQIVMNNNNGFPLTLDSEGNKSKLYSKIESKIKDKDESLFIKSFIHTDYFMNQHNSKTEGEPDIDNSLRFFETNNGRIYLDETNALNDNLDLSDKVFDNTDRNLMDLRKKRLNAKNAEIFQKVISNTFPDINIVLKSEEDINSETGFNYDGYIDKNGTLNINKDVFTAKKGFHELGHIIKEILRYSNRKFHDDIVNDITSNLDNGSDISKVADLIKAKYNEEYNKSKDDKFLLSKKDLVDEVFAEIIGLGNKNTLEQLYLDANKVPKQGLRGKFNKLIKSIITKFKEVFNIKGIKVRGNTIEDLNKAIYRIISNDNAYYFSNGELEHLNSYFKETGNHYRMDYDAAKTAEHKIRNNKGLRDLLVGENGKEPSMEEEAKKILFHMKRRSTDSELQYNFVNQDGDIFTYAKNESEEEILNKVTKDIIIPERKRAGEIKSTIINRLVGKTNIVDVNEALHGLLGKNTSMLSISNLAKYMNLDSKIVKVIDYNSLKEESNSYLKALYTEELSDTNPLLIIHDIAADGTVDMSIMDISSRMNFFGENNIFNEFMSDREYRNKSESNGLRRKEILLNSDIDSRNLSLGLILLDMQNKTNNKIRLRRISTVNIGKNDTRGKIIHDPISLIKNISLMAKIQPLMDNIESEKLKSIINLADKYNNNIHQSYLSQLRSYLTEIKARRIEDPFIISGSGNFMDSFFDDSKSVKEQLLMIENLKSYIKSRTSDNGESSTLYYLLAATSRELTNGTNELYNDVVDPSTLGKNYTPMHNMKSDYIQDVVIAVQKTINVINTKTSKTIKELAGTTKRHGIARKVMYSQLKLRPDIFAESLFINRGSEIYKHLYKTTKLYKVDKAGNKITGEKVEITLPELHYTLSDKETKALYDSGKLNDNDLELANRLLDEYKRLWIDLFLHTQNRKLRSVNAFSNVEEYTREQAEKEYDMNFRRGEIPTIAKSSSELLTQRRVGKAISKAINQVELSEALFDDMIDNRNKSIDELSNVFSEQRSTSNRYRKVGLKVVNGELVINDIDKAMDMSTDAWKTFLYFNQSTVRKIEFENRVLPIADNANILLKQLQQLGQSQEHNLEILKEYLEKNLNRRNADDDKSFQVGKEQVKISTLARMTTKAYAAAVLPLKLSIGVASFIFNTERVIVEGLSRSLTGEVSGIPKVQTFGKAAKYMFSSRENFEKARLLALRMNIYNRTERDILDQPFTNLTNFKFYQAAFLNIFNWGTDTFQRILTSTAVAMEDGSLDAYSLNKATGELDYDEKKDRQYFNEIGEFKSPEAKAEYNRVKTALIDQGEMSFDDNVLSKGYDTNWTEHVNFIVNKYIIGSFSDESKVLATNKFWGHLSAQFRIFSFDRLFNLGFLGETRSTRVGQRFTHVKDENGNIIASKQEALEMESMFNSVQRSVLEIIEYKAYTPAKFKEWYANQSNVRKYNLVKTIIQLSIFALLAGAMSLGGDDKDKEKEQTRARRFQKFLGDVMIIGTVGDMLNNPFPVVAALTRFYNGDVTAFIPASGVIKEANNALEMKSEKN